MSYIVYDYDTCGDPHRRPGLVCKDLLTYRRDTSAQEIIGVRGASFDFLYALQKRISKGARVYDPFLNAMLRELASRDRELIG